VVSLFFVLFLRQMQTWSYDFNLKSTLSGYVGYIQITDTAFVDEAILDNTIEASRVPASEIANIEGVSGVYPRLMTGALVSTGNKSKFAGVLGITPNIDNTGLKLEKKLTSGELIEEDSKGIMITEKMSKFYKVNVGDSLILYGQGYQGFTAAGLYPIKAILNFTAGDMASMVFMAMPEAQRLFASEGRYTSYLVNLDNAKDLQKIHAEITGLIDDPSLKIRTWEEVMPSMKQGIEMDSNSGLMIAGILYMIVGFGIFGTVVMLYNERTFEFGILSAIGMKRWQILLTTLIELNILTIIGVILGNLAVFPLLYHFNTSPYELTGDTAKAITDQGFEPLLGTGLFVDIFVWNSIAIMAISALTSIYIIIKILRLNPLNAMRRN